MTPLLLTVLPLAFAAYPGAVYVQNPLDVPVVVAVDGRGVTVPAGSRAALDVPWGGGHTVTASYAGRVFWTESVRAAGGGQALRVEAPLVELELTNDARVPVIVQMGGRSTVVPALSTVELRVRSGDRDVTTMVEQRGALVPVETFTLEVPMFAREVRVPVSDRPVPGQLLVSNDLGGTVRVFVDGKEAATLYDDATRRLSVSPGAANVLVMAADGGLAWFGVVPVVRGATEWVELDADHRMACARPY